METWFDNGAVARQWVAIYDAESLDIVHIHERIGLDEEDKITEAALAEEAIALSPNRPERRLEAAHPPPGMELDGTSDCEIVGGYLQMRAHAYSTYPQARNER